MKVLEGATDMEHDTEERPGRDATVSEEERPGGDDTHTEEESVGIPLTQKDQGVINHTTSAKGFTSIYMKGKEL